MTELNLKFIKEFYRQFNVRVRVYKNKPRLPGGYANYKTRTISFNRKIFTSSYNDIYKIHLIFHELCHILSVDNGKYIRYYKKQSKNYVRKMGLKVERYTDKMAYRFIRSLFKDFPICRSYSSPKAAKWYKINYLDRYFK